MRKFASLVVLVAFVAMLAACSCCNPCCPQPTCAVAASPQAAAMPMSGNVARNILANPNPLAPCQAWPDYNGGGSLTGRYYLQNVIACAGRLIPGNSQWSSVRDAADRCMNNSAPHTHLNSNWTCDVLYWHARNAWANACGSSPNASYCISELNHEDGPGNL